MRSVPTCSKFWMRAIHPTFQTQSIPKERAVYRIASVVENQKRNLDSHFIYSWRGFSRPSCDIGLQSSQGRPFQVRARVSTIVVPLGQSDPPSLALAQDVRLPRFS